MRVRALALAGLSVLSLTGCGATLVEGQASPADVAGGPAAAGPSGPELADAAADALEEAGSARVVGTMDMGGVPADLDMRMQGDDVDVVMSVDGRSMRLLLTRGSLFVQAAAPFWADQGLPDRLVDAMAGRWVLAPADPLLGAEEMTLAVFAAEVRSPTGATIEEEVTAGRLDDQPVWLVEASDGSVLTVAAEGTPFPLRLMTSGMGDARLSAFGGVEPIVAPADHLDLSGYGG